MIEDRLRRTYDAVAQRTTVRDESPPLVSVTDVSRKARRMWRLLSVAAVVLLGATSGTVFAISRSHRTVQVRTDETTTTTPLAAVLVGTEQHLTHAQPTPDIWGVGAAYGRWITYVKGGEPRAYSIDGGTSFTVLEIAKDRSPLEIGWKLPNRCAEYEGTLPIGGQGYGTQMDCKPLSDLASGKRAGVSLFPAFPKPLDITTVWLSLPPGTAFVTLRVEGDPHPDGELALWERPLDGVAAFTQHFTHYETYPAYTQHPNPVLRAYDANGTLLKQQLAPGFLGDRRVPNP